MHITCKVLWHSTFDLPVSALYGNYQMCHCTAAVSKTRALTLVIWWCSKHVTRCPTSRHMQQHCNERGLKLLYWHLTLFEDMGTASLAADQYWLGLTLSVQAPAESPGQQTYIEWLIDWWVWADSPWHMKSGMTRWKAEPLNPKPGSPVHSWRKFSAVLGTSSANKPMTMRPASLSPILISK